MPVDGESLIAAFEQAWQQGETDLSQYLASQVEHVPTNWLWELAMIDLEFRWKQTSQGHIFHDALGGQPRVEDYVRALPNQAWRTPPNFAAAEEYRVRRIWGDRPHHDHYLARFPAHLLTLPALLQAIDQELAADHPALAPPWLFPHALLPPDPRAPLPSADYLLQKHVGTGGMGKVYQAWQISLDRPVAVKALLKSRQYDAATVERFLQEGRVLAKLRHPHIVGVQGCGRFPGGGYFLVMDWIDGQDLAQHLQAGPWEISAAARLTCTVAQTLEFAHQHGVIHCDLKPANLLLDKAGQVFVSDFGLAHLLQADVPTLPAGGTWSYLAPEQATGETLTPAVDVYGLGGLLYHLLSGNPPRTSTQSLNITPHPLPSTTPTQLSNLCFRCLSFSPSLRPPTAQAVADELLDWLT